MTKKILPSDIITRRRTRENALMACLCLAFLGSLAVYGCSDSASKDRSITEASAGASPANRKGKICPQRGGTLRIALESPTSLDPALTDDVYEATVINQVFSGLVQLDANLNVLPDLAQSWTISRDRLDHSFDLRQDARFHNGRQVTAQDFVYSFTRLFDAGEVEPSIIQDYLSKVEGVDDFVAGRADTISGFRAVDPFTFEIRLAEPYPSFLNVLTMDQAKVLPREEIEALGPKGFGRKPVGSGPFRLDHWIPGDHLHLTAFSDYFGEGPYLDSLVFVHDPNSRSDWRKPAFLADDLDILEVRDNELADIMDHGSFTIMQRPELSVEFMGFNVINPVCGDRRARRAVAMAIDRQALKEFAGTGFETPAGILPPGVPGFTPRSKILPHDPKEARRLLAELGYGPENRLRLPMMTVSRSRYTVGRDSIISASLAEVGIDLDLRMVTWGEFDAALGDRSAAALQLTWIADLPDPDSFLYSLFVSEGTSNFLHYSNPGVDSLLIKGGRDTDQVARLVLYREAERIILEDAAMIPLFNVIVLFVLQPHVHGVELSPFGICSIPMERIWIDQKKAGLHAHL